MATSGFEDREDQITLDGAVTTATLGVDGVWKRWLTGLVRAYSEGKGSFTRMEMPGGDLSSSLTSVHPYVAYTLNDWVRLWGWSVTAAARCGCGLRTSVPWTPT